MKKDLVKYLLVCGSSNDEFVILGSTCIAVRDREIGEWVEDHFAIGKRVSLVSASRTRYLLKSWKLIVFSFCCRIEIGPILAVTRSTSEVWDCLYTSIRYRYLLNSSLSNEFEYDEALVNHKGSRTCQRVGEVNPIIARSVGNVRLEGDSRSISDT
jgi:hypothetical protein